MGIKLVVVCVFHFVMLFMDVIGRMQEVNLYVGRTELDVCTVDETLLMVPDKFKLWLHIPQVLSQIKELNGKCNPANFDFLFYENLWTFIQMFRRVHNR